MLIVDTDVLLVERRLRAGELTCPACGAVLAPWGHGRPREIRGDLGARLSVRPRRSRCTGCQVTHVLLPEMLWPRRSDAAEVIGAGLEIAALGMGHRQVAARLGLANGTVRGWMVSDRGGWPDRGRCPALVASVSGDCGVLPAPGHGCAGSAFDAVADGQDRQAQKDGLGHTGRHLYVGAGRGQVLVGGAEHH